MFLKEVLVYALPVVLSWASPVSIISGTGPYTNVCPLITCLKVGETVGQYEKVSYDGGLTDDWDMVVSNLGFASYSVSDAAQYVGMENGMSGAGPITDSAGSTSGFGLCISDAKYLNTETGVATCTTERLADGSPCSFNDECQPESSCKNPATGDGESIDGPGRVCTAPLSAGEVCDPAQYECRCGELDGVGNGYKCTGSKFTGDLCSTGQECISTVCDTTTGRCADSGARADATLCGTTQCLLTQYCERSGTEPTCLTLIAKGGDCSFVMDAANSNLVWENACENGSRCRLTGTNTATCLGLFESPVGSSVGEVTQYQSESYGDEFCVTGCATSAGVCEECTTPLVVLGKQCTFEGEDDGCGRDGKCLCDGSSTQGTCMHNNYFRTVYNKPITTPLEFKAYLDKAFSNGCAFFPYVPISSALEEVFEKYFQMEMWAKENEADRNAYCFYEADPAYFQKIVCDYMKPISTSQVFCNTRANTRFLELCGAQWGPNVRPGQGGQGSLPVSTASSLADPSVAAATALAILVSVA